MTEWGQCVTHHICDCLDAELERLRAREAALTKGYTVIREEYGRVCADFELCTHESCRSSYSAWAVADSMLKFGKLPEEVTEADWAKLAAEERNDG
jgi:hypothetical protein